ncbi:hypothetical protein HDV00_007659 [Rhizophlyctis rosea]|nr:hypothetical protein HDV00_007659 [Rhizophlyctis rosea]
MTTGCLYFQRFYLRRSFKEYNVYEIAAACLFTAAKVEENIQKLEKFALCCAKKAQKNDNAQFDHTSHVFRRWKERIIQNEELVLTTLCFELEVDHPDHFMMRIMRALASKYCGHLGLRVNGPSLGGSMMVEGTGVIMAV